MKPLDGELMGLILNCQSMDKVEHRHFIELLPHMNCKQKHTLYTLLAKERYELNNIDKRSIFLNIT